MIKWENLVKTLHTQSTTKQNSAVHYKKPIYIILTMVNKLRDENFRIHNYLPGNSNEDS